MPQPPSVLSLTQRAARVLAGCPATYSKSPQRYPAGLAPEALVSGEGAYGWSPDGRRWLDTVAALGPILLGYGHRAVEKAVVRQLARGTSFSLMHPLEVEVAELLCDLIPGAECVRFARNGKDVTEAAARLARFVTGKRHVVYCGYHGGFSDYLITTDHPGGVLPHLVEFNHQIPWNDAEALRELFEAYRNDIAAILFEVPPEPPERTPEDTATTMRWYVDTAHQAGALAICDEVVTGLRYGLGGAQARYGVTADLATFSKALANGLPLAALTGPRDLLRHCASGATFMSTTFGGETTALAAAQAVLVTLRDTDALANLRTHGTRLLDGLRGLFYEYALPAEVWGNDARLAVRWEERDAGTKPDSATRRGAETPEAPDVPVSPCPRVAVSPSSAAQLRTLWLAEMARRGILMNTGVALPMTCYTATETQALLTAAEAVCALMRQALDGGGVAAALPCAVLGDVLRVR